MLTDLQSEIRSLKGLLANRGRGPLAGSSSANELVTGQDGTLPTTSTTGLAHGSTTGYMAGSSLTSLIGSPSASRPTIPAWQLTGNNSAAAVAAAATVGSKDTASSTQDTPADSNDAANDSSADTLA